MTIEVPVMVMLGGMGTVFGPIIGAFFYVVLKEFVWANFIDWHSGILGLIIVLLIYFAPGGVLGTVRGWIRKGVSGAVKQVQLKPAGEVN
jgi:ABC-type branched-subunit amino acid transport system permease subunit